MAKEEDVGEAGRDLLSCRCEELDYGCSLIDVANATAASLEGLRSATAPG
jgi:hypothetical protein